MRKTQIHIEHRRTTLTKAFDLAIVLTAILTAFLTAPTVQAQGNGPGFHVSAGGDLNCPGGAPTISTATPPASISPITFPCTSGQGTAAAEADTFRVRALGRSEHTCCGTASGGNGSARIQFDDVIISGPAAASIPVSLNFRLRGTLTGNTNFGQHGLFLFLRLGGMSTDSKIEANDLGIYNQSGVFAPLTVGFPDGAIDQTFVTPVGNVSPNQPLRFDIQLGAASAMAGNGFTQVDFFSGSNGFFLPFGTPVFNLPPGYTINIPEMNIINNFVALPAVINGDIFVVGTNASEISFAGVNQVTGSVTIDDNSAATVIDLSSLHTAGGGIKIDGNTSATSIDLSTLDTVGGSVRIDGNTSAIGIDLSELDTAGGGIKIDGNTSATSIDLSTLDTVGGGISIDGNQSAIGIDLSELDTAGGGIKIDGNQSATVVDLASLGTVNGDLDVLQNGSCTNVILGALTTITGNLTLESCGTGAFTPGPAAAGGNATLNTTGYDAVNGTTANGTTSLRNRTSEASMTVQLSAGSFSTPVSFSLTHLNPATLNPELGLDANNAPALIDPVTGYQINFGIPTLNRDATLSFDVFLNSLDTSTANALLAAITNDSATLVTRAAAAGSQYQAFPICGAGQQPTAGGCVLVELLDANGQPTTGTPSIVRFSNVVGHFSTWAVAIVTPQESTSYSFNGLLSPYPAPPFTTTPTFKRGRVVPLNFNWVDSGGGVVDSANANPSVTIFPASCTTQAPATAPITPEAAGNSGGLHYDAITRTWTFNWSTKPLASGCFTVRVNASNTTYAAPPNVFPIALRDH